MSTYTDAEVNAAIIALFKARQGDLRLTGQAKAVLDAVAPAIAARALRDVADKWQQGQWADAPRRADRAQERIANAQHVTDWLRSHAEQVEQMGADR